MSSRGPERQTMESYESLKKWYVDTCVNMQNIDWICEIHRRHLIQKMMLETLPRDLIAYSKGYEKRDQLVENFKRFVDRLDGYVGRFMNQPKNVTKRFYSPDRTHPLCSGDKDLLDRYLPEVPPVLISSPPLTSQQRDIVDRNVPGVLDAIRHPEATKYPQDEGELSEIVSKNPPEREFCIAGSFTNHQKTIDWKNIKRLHVGSLEQLRELPDDHPLEEIIYSRLHQDDGEGTCDIPPIRPEQWLWKNPVKLVMVYDTKSELDELLLPYVGLNLFAIDDLIHDDDLIGGKTPSEIYDFLTTEIKKSHDQYEYLDDQESQIGDENTTEIHIPDDSRISSVEIVLYAGDTDPKSKLIRFFLLKLKNSLRFGNRDMSTVTYTVI